MQVCYIQWRRLWQPFNCYKPTKTETKTCQALIMGTRKRTGHLCRKIWIRSIFNAIKNILRFLAVLNFSILSIPTLNLACLKDPLNRPECYIWTEMLVFFHLEFVCYFQSVFSWNSELKNLSWLLGFVYYYDITFQICDFHAWGKQSPLLLIGDQD